MMPATTHLCAMAAFLLGAAITNTCARAQPAAPDAAAPKPKADARVQWHAFDPMPVGVFDAAVSATGGEPARAVVTGGLNSGGASEASVQVLDLATGKWSPGPRLQHARAMHAQVTLCDGRVLVIGGRAGTVPGRLAPVSVCEVIDLTANTATSTVQIAKLAQHPTAHTLPDGRVVVVSGASGTVLDATGRRIVGLIRLRRERTSHASLLLDGRRVLVAGGQGCETFEVIDVDTGVSLQLAAKLPGPMDDLALARIDEHRVWVLAGQGRDGRTVDATWVLDMNNSRRATLAEGPPLLVPGGVADHVVGAVDHWVVTAGGEADLGTHDVEHAAARLLDTRTLRVYALPSLPEPQDDAVAVTHGRDVIVIGGYRMQNFFGAASVPIAVRAVHRMHIPQREK